MVRATRERASLVAKLKLTVGEWTAPLPTTGISIPLSLDFCRKELPLSLPSLTTRETFPLLLPYALPSLAVRLCHHRRQRERFFPQVIPFLLSSCAVLITDCAARPCSHRTRDISLYIYICFFFSFFFFFSIITRTYHMLDTEVERNRPTNFLFFSFILFGNGYKCGKACLRGMMESVYSKG